MRIVVFGAGGAGGYFGGRLAQAGEDVVFVARGEHLRALRADGLRVSSIAGDFDVRPTVATDDPASVGVADAVIVTVKTWQVPKVAEAMRPLVGPHTAILPLQNGVEAADQLASVLGAEHVLGGVAKIFSMVEAPGHIRHFGAVPSIALGELDGVPSSRVARLAAALARAGISVEVPANIRVTIWEKFLFFASYGAVGSATRAPAGVVRELPETRRLLEAAMREVDAVARARNVPLAENAVTQAMAFVDGLTPNGTPSMQRDIVAGRPSELEALSGAVVRFGLAAGVPTPVHALLYAVLLPQERHAREAMPLPS